MYEVYQKTPIKSLLKKSRSKVTTRLFSCIFNNMGGPQSNHHTYLMHLSGMIFFHFNLHQNVYKKIEKQTKQNREIKGNICQCDRRLLLLIFIFIKETLQANAHSHNSQAHNYNPSLMTTDQDSFFKPHKAYNKQFCLTSPKISNTSQEKK